MIRTIAKGTLQLTGPDELLEQPSDDGIRERFAATDWNPKSGGRHFAQEQHRMGMIETRIQLDYLCADDYFGPSLQSWAAPRGVKVEVIVSAKASHPRR